MGRIRIGEFDGKGFTKAKRDRRYDCWFCDDSNKHLYVSFTMLVYHCFKCGASGKIIDEANLGSYEAIINRLKNKTKDDYMWVAVTNLSMKKIIKTLPRNIIVSSDRVVAYLHSRHISKKDMVKNDIRESIDTTGIYSKTIIFPIGGEHRSDECKYFVARKYDGSEPKYVNAPWPKDGVLYSPMPRNFGYPVYATVICEGVFDAFAINNLGVTHTYSLLGKEASIEQMKNIVGISPSNQPIIIALDADAFGYGVKLKLMLSEMLMNPSRVRVAMIPKGQDPNSMQPRELKGEIERCVSLAQQSKR